MASVLSCLEDAGDLNQITGLMHYKLQCRNVPKQLSRLGSLLYCSSAMVHVHVCMYSQALMFCHDRVSSEDYFIPRRHYARIKQDPVDLILSGSVLNYVPTSSLDNSLPLSRDVPSTRKEDATIVYLQRTNRPLVRDQGGGRRGEGGGVLGSVFPLPFLVSRIEKVLRLLITERIGNRL